MNILILSNNDINDNIKSNLISKLNEHKIYEKVNLKQKYDICIIISDDILKIEEFTKKVKCKIIVLTSNLDSEYILKVIAITKNIIYSNLDIDEIINRINNIQKNIKEK